jgi:hypothetical protein
MSFRFTVSITPSTRLSAASDLSHLIFSDSAWSWHVCPASFVSWQPGVHLHGSTSLSIFLEVGSFLATTKMVGSAGASEEDREVMFVVRDQRFIMRRSALQVRTLHRSSVS